MIRRATARDTERSRKQDFGVGVAQSDIEKGERDRGGRRVAAAGVAQ